MVEVRDVDKGASFSPCRTWRYALWRVWDNAVPRLNVIGLNPSTADETADDQTIRRCVGFARTWGYGGLVMTNLFAFRSRDPKGLLDTPDPVGPDNDAYLWEQAAQAGRVVVAWGVPQAGLPAKRVQMVLRLLSNVELHCIQRTKGGHPKHPLYAAGGLLPAVYQHRQGPLSGASL